MLLVDAPGVGVGTGVEAGTGVAVGTGAAVGVADGSGAGVTPPGGGVEFGAAVAGGELGSGAAAYGSAPPDEAEPPPPPPHAASAGRHRRSDKRTNAETREVLKDFITPYVFGVKLHVLKLPARQAKERRTITYAAQVVIGKALGCFSGTRPSRMQSDSVCRTDRRTQTYRAHRTHAPESGT